MIPKLSILIPAFHYPFGVIRILNLIDKKLKSKVEIIISDDSSDNSLKRILYLFDFKILYLHNSPSLGAPQNWNNLISMASGEYLYLIHHDEFTINKKFFLDLLDIIEKNKKIDLLIFNLLKINKHKIPIFFLPFLFRKLLVKIFPRYIYVRNFIGPISSIVIKKSFCPKFNNDFRWLVDVVFYMEIFKRNPEILFCKELMVVSEYQRDQSISSKIKNDLSLIIKNEQLLIKDLYKFDIFFDSSFLAILVRTLECILWNTFVALMRVFGQVKVILNFYVFMKI